MNESLAWIVKRWGVTCDCVEGIPPCQGPVIAKTHGKLGGVSACRGSSRNTCCTCLEEGQMSPGDSSFSLCHQGRCVCSHPGGPVPLVTAPCCSTLHSFNTFCRSQPPLPDCGFLSLPTNIPQHVSLSPTESQACGGCKYDCSHADPPWDVVKDQWPQQRHNFCSASPWSKSLIILRGLVPRLPHQALRPSRTLHIPYALPAYTNLLWTS